MLRHEPRLPSRLRFAICRHYGWARAEMTRRMYRLQKGLGLEPPAPLPWYVGHLGEGPLVRPWAALAGWMRKKVVFNATRPVEGGTA